MVHSIKKGVDSVSNPIIGAGAVAVPFLGAIAVSLAGRMREQAVPHLAVATGYLNAFLGVSLVLRRSFAVSILGCSYLSVVSDGLGSFVSATGAVLGALILTYSLKYIGPEDNQSRYYSLALSLIGAMSGLALSGNLLSAFVFWEICRHTSFALVSLDGGNAKALRAAKFAKRVTDASNFGLFAALVSLSLYTVPRTLDIWAIVEQAGLMPGIPLAIAGFGILAAAAGLSAQIPFHSWLPGAMEAPTSASALVDAATTLNGGVYLVLRMYPVFRFVPGWTRVVTFVGAITIVFAAVMALKAKDLKVVLAYSTMSQLGYMFLGAGVGGFLAAEFHMVSHAVFKTLLFLAAGAVIHDTHTRDLRAMSGMGKKMPLTGRCFLLGAMGLSGVPLFGGFFSKDMIFAVALKEKHYLPLAFGVAGAALTFTYIWRTYRKVFGGTPSSAAEGARDPAGAMLWPLCVLGALTFTSWLVIGLLSRRLHETLPYVKPLSPLHLVQETFSSTAFFLSLMALVGGGTAVWVIKDR